MKGGRMMVTIEPNAPCGSHTEYRMPRDREGIRQTLHNDMTGLSLGGGRAGD